MAAHASTNCSTLHRKNRSLIRTHQHLDENEFVNVEAHTVEELKQMIFEGKIEDSKTVAAILAYDAKYNR